MSTNQLPERIAFLILLYLHRQLSDIQRKELDRWILLEKEHKSLFDKAINLDPDDHTKFQTPLLEQLIKDNTIYTPSNPAKPGSLYLESRLLQGQFNLLVPPNEKRVLAYRKTRDPKVFDGLKRRPT